MNRRTDLTYENINTKEAFIATEIQEKRCEIACLILKNNLSIAGFAEHIDDEEELNEEENKELNENMLIVSDIIISIIEENQDKNFIQLRESLDVEEYLLKD